MSILAITGGTGFVGGRTIERDLVAIDGPDGAIARGLAEYDAAEATMLIGRRSEDQATLLGYALRAALVHRSHMALL